MKKLILAAVTLAASATVTAEQVPSNSIAQCAMIGEDLPRLACYDQLAKTLGVNGRHAMKARAGDTGKWVLDKQKNPIDDSRTVTLTLKADSGGSRFGKPITLVARCHSNKTEVLINWRAYLGSEANVTLRIGDGDASTSRWELLSDRQASYHSTPIKMLKDLLAADKMVAQVTPFNVSPSIAIFDTSGLDQAIKPLRETCGW
ncbi:type VI secretion system-associated protein TagO [Oceanisphaera sp.]|uniref:type VI secretion system-associated protein TagO n=1 Tax=Oceanisphaera sp. TaxID=1929979 RepID=UPI003A91B68E